LAQHIFRKENNDGKYFPFLKQLDDVQFIGL